MPDLLNQFHSSEFWRGALFPIGVTGSPVRVGEDLDEVYSSVLQIINVRRGERIYYPEFGSDLSGLLFEPNDLFLEQQLRTELIRSLAIWEPRIRIVAIDFETNPNLKNLGIIIVVLDIRLVNNPRLSQVIHVPLSSQGTIFR